MQDKKYDTFLSYQFTGIDPEIRKENISKIINLLESEGRKVFCSDILEEEFDKRNLSLEERYQECLRVQESQDFKEIVFFVMDKPESKGMKLELEKAKERIMNDTAERMQASEIKEIKGSVKGFKFRQKGGVESIKWLIEFNKIDNVINEEDFDFVPAEFIEEKTIKIVDKKALSEHIRKVGELHCAKKEERESYLAIV
jgi:membrane carboxypeptidase/penicillin-binding protein PbpC